MVGIYNKRLVYRRRLVKKATKAEKRFRELIKKLKYKYSFQKVINKPKFGFYIVDFYIPKFNTIVEIDGGYHFNKRQVKKDKYREEILRSLGYRIIRFTNKETMKLTTSDIKKHLTNKL